MCYTRADRDVYVSDPWHTASDVTLSFYTVLVQLLLCCKHNAYALAQAIRVEGLALDSSALLLHGTSSVDRIGHRAAHSHFAVARAQ